MKTKVQNKKSKHYFNCVCIAICIFIFYFTNSSALFSQTPSDIVDLKNPDLLHLDSISFYYVNLLRQEKKLAPFVWDDVLYRAAKDHADYLIKEENISHYQKTIEKSNPGKRVKIHGGIDYPVVGENIVQVLLGIEFPIKGKLYNTLDYKTTGKAMALLWKHSPNHYTNIISEKYNYSALATSYDSTTQKTVAVQVFGFSNNPPSSIKQKDFSEYLLNQPRPKLPFGLKKYKSKKKYNYSINGFIKLKYDKGHLTGNYRAAKKIFKGRRSGITQEFISKSDYDSSSKNFSMVPNRRNGMYELNGKLSKPVYRKQLLRYSKLLSERRYFIYTPWLKIKGPPKHFIFPLIDKTDDEEYMIFLIKNKRLISCRTYMNVPTEFFDTPFPHLNFASDFKQIDTLPKFVKHSKYDTLNIKVFYKPGSVTIDSDKQKRINISLKSIKGKVIHISASAFASIEGKSSSNKDLAKQRLSHFITLVNPWLNTMSYTKNLESGEQWEMFFNQIKDTHYQYLSSSQKKEIRKFVNSHKNDSTLSKLLDEQRYVEFKLISRYDYKLPVISFQSPVEKYDSLIQAIKRIKNPAPELFDSLETAQLEYYHYLCQNKNLLLDSIIPFPRFEKHLNLVTMTLFFNTSS